MKAEPYGRFKPLPLEAETLLEEGQIIDAMKSLRASHNLGLRDAQELDRRAHRLGAAAAREARNPPKAARRKLFYIFLVMDAFIAAGLIYYFVYMPR